MTQTPNREVIQAWVDALRSGDYKQGVGALRDNKDNYCCLGVLCDLKDPDAWHMDHPNQDHFQWGGCGAFLPAEVSIWAGIHPEVYLDEDNSDSQRAALINDSGVPFSAIADRIERKYLSEETA